MTQAIKNRYGQSVTLDNIDKVNMTENGYEITGVQGWGTFYITFDELDGFVPQEGDAFVLMTTNFSYIRGIIIEHRVIRYMTDKQVEESRQRMLDGFRLSKLEEYVKNGEALKARAEALPTPLRDRMRRFSEGKDGVEFWIDSAPYEMAVLEGAAALLRKVAAEGFIFDTNKIRVDDDTDGAINWIEDWWALNTKEHNYDYKKQMEIVPDFGDGHSGFTASAAKGMALAILRGEEI